METRFTGTAHLFGDSIDTDMIVPGKYLAIIDAEGLAKHVLEGADPTFAGRVRKGDVLVAGENFGCGSSREHAPLALKGAGISVVIAESFARIFYRNAINLGLPAIVAPGVAKALKSGEKVTVDISKGEIHTPAGKVVKAEPLSAKAIEILEAGGLVNIVRRKLGTA